MLAEAVTPTPQLGHPGRHHLVVLRPRYLDLIQSGRKRLECRLSRSRIAPYGCVSPGDVLWLKRSGGPVSAITTAERVWHFGSHLPHSFEWLREFHADALHAEPDFWRKCETARFGVLIRLGPVQPLEPFRIAKADRRGWVLLSKPLVPEQRDRTAVQQLFKPPSCNAAAEPQ